MKFLTSLILLMFFMLIGCSTNPAPLVSPTLPQTKTPIQITTSPKEPTNTPIPPSATTTATLRSPTATRTPSPTNTMQPTLKSAEVTQAVLDLLQTNGNCQTPCLWGIVPGETTYEQALQFFRHFGKSPFESGNENYYNFQLDMGETLLNIRITLRIEAQTVSSVEFFLSGSKLHKVDPTVWEAYTLPRILEDYGVPSQVLLFGDISRNIPPGMEPQIFFAHALIFEPVGLAVFYGKGAYEKQNSMYHICPLAEDPAMGPVWFYVGENPFEELQTAFDFTDSIAVTLPDNNTFYEMFLHGNEETCLELDTDLFIPFRFRKN